jgi:hypothetical protein
MVTNYEDDYSPFEFPLSAHGLKFAPDRISCDWRVPSEVRLRCYSAAGIGLTPDFDCAENLSIKT